MVIAGSDSLQVVLDYLEKPELLKNSANYFREYLVTDEEVARQHEISVSNLRKHYLAMGLEKMFVEEIQELLAFKVNDIDRLASKQQLDYILNHSDRHEIMQKYAYLSLLINNDVTVYAQMNADYFGQTIFAPLFAGHPPSAVGNDFLSIEHDIDRRFTDMVNSQIDRLSSNDGINQSSSRYRLRSSSDIEQSYRRSIDSSVSITSIIDRRSYRYQLDTAIDIVANRIADKLSTDVDDAFTMTMAIECVKLDTATDEQREMVNELFFESIVETDLIKLPNYFRENLTQIAHMHKQKVADAVLHHVANRLGEDIAAGKLPGGQKPPQIGQPKNRNAIPATAENIELVKLAKRMPLDQLAKDAALFNLASYNKIGVDLEKRAFELIRSESDAKLHSIIFNPDNQGIPDNLADMTPEELKANGIRRVQASEISISSDGSILDIDARHIDDILNHIENVYDRQSIDQSTDSIDIDDVYDDRFDDK